MPRTKQLSATKRAQLKNWSQRTSGEITNQALLVEGLNRVLLGGRVFAPTSASTQVTGAGATTVRVNIDNALVNISGSLFELPASGANQADFVAATASPLLAQTQSIVIAVVVYKNTAGNPVFLGVAGTPAATGSQVAPLDSVVQAGVNTANAAAFADWVKLAEVTVNRTADTTLTQTHDNTKKDTSLVM